MTAGSPATAIIDIDCGLPADQVAAAAAALQRQLREHVAPLWGLGFEATVRASTSNDAGEQRLELRKAPPNGGTDWLGLHELDEHGVPILYVLPELCAQYGDDWRACASHELIEALLNPYLHRCVQAPNGAIYALEVCDQVEADVYELDGVPLSNFNTPANFEPPSAQQGNPPGVHYDYLGLQKSPLEVRPGGYAQVWMPGAGWHQLGQRRAYRCELARLGIGRGAQLARRFGAAP